MKYTLRDYQVDVIGRTREAIRNGARRPVIALPTGGGKTVIGASIIESVVGLGRRCLFAAHREELILQTSRKLSEIGVENHGMIWARAPRERVDYARPVQIASVQTLQSKSRRDLQFDFDLVIVDECHHVTAENSYGAMLKLGRVNINGLMVAEVDTTLGEVELQLTSARPGERTTVRTSDALVTIDSHEGELDIATTNAPIEMFGVVGNVRASTTQGPITARISPPPGGEVFLATTNAPIDLSLPREFGARLLAVTSAPGAVFISSDLVFRPSNSFPDQAEGTLGNGAGRVDVRTSVADISIHR